MSLKDDVKRLHKFYELVSVRPWVNVFGDLKGSLMRPNGSSTPTAEQAATVFKLLSFVHQIEVNCHSIRNKEVIMKEFESSFKLLLGMTPDHPTFKFPDPGDDALYNSIQKLVDETMAQIAYQKHNETGRWGVTIHRHSSKTPYIDLRTSGANLHQRTKRIGRLQIDYGSSKINQEDLNASRYKFFENGKVLIPLGLNVREYKTHVEETLQKYTTYFILKINSLYVKTTPTF